MEFKTIKYQTFTEAEIDYLNYKKMFRDQVLKAYDVLLEEVYSPEIIDIINPKYPRWILWEVKRKYGNKPAEYIYWCEFKKSLFDFLPKAKWSNKDWNVIK